MDLLKYPGVGRNGHFCKGHYLYCNFGYQYLACKAADKPDEPLLGLPMMQCYADEYYARQFLTTLHQWKNPLDIISRLMSYLLGDEQSLSRFSEAQAIRYLVDSLLNRDLLIFEMDEPRMTYSGHWGKESSSSSSAKNNNLVLEEGSGQGVSQSAKTSKQTAINSSEISDSGSSNVQAGDARVKTEPDNKELAARISSEASVEAEATSLEEVKQRLEQARERLIATGEYQPKYSQAELEALVAQDRITSRFVVTLQKIKAGDQPVGYKRDSGRTTTWITTFDQMENGDTDPKLLNDLNGMTWDDKAEWEIIIIDQGEYFKQDGALAFIPTYENTAALGQAEFSEDFSEETLQTVMKPEYSQQYADDISDYKAKGGHLYDSKQLVPYAEKRFTNDQDYDAFMARHEYTMEIGTNEHFSGDGLTKTKGESGYLAKGQHGTLETIIFEKSPETMNELEARGAILRIPAKSIA